LKAASLILSLHNGFGEPGDMVVLKIAVGK
jgi:hypothetical protein